MKKTEIIALDNESLVAHLMGLEMTIAHESNSRKGGVTKKTIEDFKWTMSELCTRFDLDIVKMINKTGTLHWWE